MLRFLKDYTLPLSMLLGVIGFPLFRHLTPILSTLIFFMLFFTFCKVNPVDLRLHRWHWFVLLSQLLLTVGSYYLLLPIDAVLAQGVMLCFIMPTATAAPIIAGKLGGSIQSLTSFTLLSNVATALIVPVFFPIVNPSADMTFIVASLTILRKIAPLLLGPFLLAWAWRLIYDGVQKRRHTDKRFHLPRSLASMPFYLWAFSLVILMADITHTLIYDDYNYLIAICQTVGALLSCLIQYFVGKRIGQRFPSYPHGQDYADVLVEGAKPIEDVHQITRISAGQAFGQKNTTLGIWMAHTYLNPISAIGAAAYIVWQNLFNSWQLARAAHGKRV